MDKLVIGLLGAVAGLATAGSAQAMTSPAANPAEGVTTAASYAELLDPIPNAVETLKADDAARAAQPTMEGVQQADYDGYNRGYRGGYGREYGYQHHHHHNHYRYGERYGSYHRPGPSYHHHHHHHHRYDNRYRGRNEFIGIPGVGGFVVGR